MCGDWINPSNRHFLGGPIGQTALSLAAAPLLGPTVGAALGVGDAAGAGLAGALAGGLTGSGGGLSGALRGAALGGTGGYLAGGGLTDLLNTTGLSSLGDTLSNAGGALSKSLGFADDAAPVDAARAAVSSAATPPAGPLTNYLGGSGANGGGSGGFFDIGKSLATPGLDSSGIDALASGLSPTGSTPSIAKGLGPVFPGNNLLNGAAKAGLTYALTKPNTGGYSALQGASRQAAANYQPFLNTGTAADNTLADLYGLNGQQAAQSATQNWQDTPGYQFALNQGVNALDASAARRGMLLSGNQQQAVQNYGTGLANQYYNQYLSGLQNQINPALAAAQGIGQGGIDAATAYAAGKGQNATAFNTALPSLMQYLFPTPNPFAV